MKYKRLNFKRIQSEYNDKIITIGPDSGTMGLKTYYYVQINMVVVMHGFIRQSEAKDYVMEMIKRDEL